MYLCALRERAGRVPANWCVVKDNARNVNVAQTEIHRVCAETKTRLHWITNHHKWVKGIFGYRFHLYTMLQINEVKHETQRIYGDRCRHGRCAADGQGRNV